jgi:hypothetical protein
MTQQEIYRGYRITVEDRGPDLRVYVNPTAASFPIFHCDHFDTRGSLDQALDSTHREIDRLLDLWN